jgi:hypothetical protein
MLVVLVQSVIRRFPNSFCPVGKIRDRTHGCKGRLLKVREGKRNPKGYMRGPRQNLEAKRTCFCSSDAFKT